VGGRGRGAGRVGGCVGGGVGGGVGNGVGGIVGTGAGITVGGTVAQPRPTVAQQKSFCAWDHGNCVVAPKPASQLNGSDVDVPDSSQQSRGMSNSRLRRQQLVKMQVKSLLGLMTSKSPPCPTYL